MDYEHKCSELHHSLTRRDAAVLDGAVFRLRRGQPLPLDIAAQLLSMGVDVSTLEQTYSA